MKNYNFTLTLTLISILLGCLPTRGQAQSPINDGFSNSVMINGKFGTTTGTNVGGTSESGEQFARPYSNRQTSWWSWTAPEDGWFYFHTTGSSFDTILGAYQGAVVNTLTLIHSDDDTMGGKQSLISIDATQGQIYHFQVDGYDSSKKGQGKITLSWGPFPTMVYSWREVFTYEGAAFGSGSDEYVWSRRSSFVSTGLVVRGRSDDVYIPSYGVEHGPIAFFHFTPVRAGKKTTFYFVIETTMPNQISPNSFEGGFGSYLADFGPNAPKVNEEVHFQELNSGGNVTTNTRFMGKATLKAPFSSAPKTWFASTLSSVDQYYRILNTGDFPDQGEPEWSNYNKSAQTLKFSASETARVKFMKFDEAVESIRLNLISKGFIEGAAP